MQIAWCLLLIYKYFVVVVVVATIILDLSGLSNISADATVEEIAAIFMENPAGMLIYLGYFLFLVVAVITGVVLFITKRKKFVVQPGEITIEKGQRFKTMILNVGMILYCIFWIAMIIIQLCN